MKREMPKDTKQVFPSAFVLCRSIYETASRGPLLSFDGSFLEGMCIYVFPHSNYPNSPPGINLIAGFLSGSRLHRLAKLPACRLGRTALHPQPVTPWAIWTNIQIIQKERSGLFRIYMDSPSIYVRDS